MNTYIEANRRHWDEAAPHHVVSELYDVDAFRRGESKLKHVELEELGDVRGKTLLHLQCHFGLDTLSWAREGAVVTGVDFSALALDAARGLAHELGIEARFVQSDVYALPDNLHGQFDIVFTSYGAINWLPDIRRWAQIAASSVRPGGTFYMVEFHPFAGVFDDRPGTDELRVVYPYFTPDPPLRFENENTYATSATLENRETFEWPHPVGDVVTALIDAGLRIEFLHEFPFSTYPMLPIMEQTRPGEYRLTRGDGSVPLMFSLRAMKAEA